MSNTVPSKKKMQVCSMNLYKFQFKNFLVTLYTVFVAMQSTAGN